MPDKTYLVGYTKAVVFSYHTEDAKRKLGHAKDSVIAQGIRFEPRHSKKRTFISNEAVHTGRCSNASTL